MKSVLGDKGIHWTTILKHLTEKKSNVSDRLTESEYGAMVVSYKHC